MLPFRFDYEEKLLERVIRSDLQMQQALEKLETAMGKVDGGYFNLTCIPFYHSVLKMKDRECI